jgi:hypothetical protein
MPLAALTFALFALAGPIDPAAAGISSATPLLAQQPSAQIQLAADDDAYGNQDDENEGTYSDDPDFNYGYEGDDDEDSSAHGPDDDDDGWDIDDTVRSERA